MANTHQLSSERPHLGSPPSNDTDCLRQPITTFTALLRAAQSTDIDTPAEVNRIEATITPHSSVNKRRLRNRVSCRKTRLKRKLQQHLLETLARERHARHDYLEHLDTQLRSTSNHHQRDCKLFREFAAKSLHYALVDPEYGGWFDAGMDQEPQAFGEQLGYDNEEVDHLQMRRSKCIKRGRGDDVSSALRKRSQTSQSLLFEQWQPIVDELQNIDLQLHQMDENELIPGVFDRYCYWDLVGVSIVKVKQAGEIATVAVSGVTRLRFRGRHIKEVSISTIRREENVPCDFNTSSLYTPKPDIQSEAGDAA
uniref:BZIP domain-containing protein n=1 Tax=Peronospora matthiolae TaxID=2874970 RepID=A0AAV1TS34_9STRA